MDLKHIIDQKDHYADYMVDEITHICRDFEKREPGSKGEQQACEYMAQVLKKDCGCQRADVESFKENPGSLVGFILPSPLCWRPLFAFSSAHCCLRC